MHLQPFIDRLEYFAGLRGVRIERCFLDASVLGNAGPGRVVLRTGLCKQRQILTLIHELTHVLVHCGAEPRLNRTVCEYEAEAVERLVGAQLRLEATRETDLRSLTDDLLASSVVRVRQAAAILLAVAQGLQTQAAVEIQAAPGEEIILDDELRGMRDLVRLTETL